MKSILIPIPKSSIVILDQVEILEIYIIVMRFARGQGWWWLIVFLIVSQDTTDNIQFGPFVTGVSVVVRTLLTTDCTDPNCLGSVQRFFLTSVFLCQFSQSVSQLPPETKINKQS